MLRSPVVIFLIILGAITALFNRFIALLVYVWFALFRPQEWIWIDISSFRPSLVLGLILLIPSLATGIFPNLSHPLTVGSVAFLLTGLLAQVHATRPDIGWIWLDYLVRLTVVCLLAVTLVTTRRRLFWLVAVTAISMGIHSAKTGVMFLLGSGIRISEGLAGAFIDNNGYALAIAMIIPLLIATAQNMPRDLPFSKWARLGFLVAAPLSVLTIIGTFSRGGLLALLAGLFVLILMHRRRFLVLTVVVVLVAAVGPFVPIPEGYFDRVETIQTFQEVDETSAMSRLHFWRVAMDMVKDNPIGVGLKNFEQRYDQYDFLKGQYGTRRAAHNSHFQVLAEQGYAGAIVWLALFAYAVFVCLRVKRRARGDTVSPGDRAFDVNYANALLASMAAFVVGGSFIALSLNDLTWLTFALVASLDRVQKQSISGAAVPDRWALPMSPPRVGFSPAARIRMP